MPEELDLTPTEWLIMEVLAARWRLGEPRWPFPNRLKPTLRSLQTKGLISFKGHTIEKHQTAWLTTDGKRTSVSPTYILPIDRKVVDQDDNPESRG